jgi:hypothetical protein
LAAGISSAPARAAIHSQQIVVSGGFGLHRNVTRLLKSLMFLLAYLTAEQVDSRTPIS